MKALRFKLVLNSLYSIRIPFTWQSALTYPILPPSAVIGLCANALQRLKNDRHPLEYLKYLEEKVIWAGSRLLTPCVIKSYVTSTIVKWEGKPTNALGRQFAYARSLESLVVFNNDENLIRDLTDALISSPITCGDSESPAYVDGKPEILDVTEVIAKEVETVFPVPFTHQMEIIKGKGQIYLMHERCYKGGDFFPLKSFIVPVKEDRGILYPTSIKLRGENLRVLNMREGLTVVITDETHKDPFKDKMVRKKSKNK